MILIFYFSNVCNLNLIKCYAKYKTNLAATVNTSLQKIHNEPIIVIL